MQTIKGAVIAAAGLGSRLGCGVPKCLIEVEGVCLLSHLIRCVERHVEVIHVVVGYREELIQEYCSTHHRNVVLVRNALYRSTMTSSSYALGAKHLDGKILYLDGDLLMAETECSKFVEAAVNVPVLVGITGTKSDNPVYVSTVHTGGTTKVTGFSYDHASSHEWANVLCAPADFFSESSGHVFHTLSAHLPLPAHEIVLYEIDTDNDLKNASAGFLRQFSDQETL